MTTYLVYDAPARSPEVRHEVAEPTDDPVVFMEHDGTRIVAGSLLDHAIFSTREDVVDEYWSWHELGVEELISDDALPEHMIGPELVVRAVRRVEAKTVCVPPAFHALVADVLRSNGVEVVVNAAQWARRRRQKTPWELEGCERAQRAAETAMLTAARMLRDAEPTARGQLRFEGEILTAELVREAMNSELTSQGAESHEIMVHSGDAWLNGRAGGLGPLTPDTSCIIDCWPRDRRTGAHADLTRTFVAGTPRPELVELHADCRAALDIALEAIRPGHNDAYERVAEYLHSRGHATQLHHSGREPFRHGFWHSLGHGVGLEIHEPPSIGRRSDSFLAGDVVAIEPGLYAPGIGGVRLEDTVLVTDAGVEYFTDPYPYDLQP
jgi:Xaa-Pro aminopeptidase